MMFTLNLIKTSLPRIIPASKPCRYLLGNFLNNFLSWVNEKTPPPSIPLKHHLEAINAAMASVHFSTGLMQVWNRPHCDWFTIRNAHFQGLLCFRVLTFSEFFMNNFGKAARLPIKFYLTSEFWILFFFLHCWKKCPPERECHPLPFSAWRWSLKVFSDPLSHYVLTITLWHGNHQSHFTNEKKTTKGYERQDQMYPISLNTIQIFSLI